MSHLRDAAELLAPVVAETLSELELQPKDQAAAKLASRYAECIDKADDAFKPGTAGSPEWAMRWIGPLLLDCLESLGATPAARSRLKDGTAPVQSPKLAQLRAASRRA